MEDDRRKVISDRLNSSLAAALLQGQIRAQLSRSHWNAFATSGLLSARMPDEIARGGSGDYNKRGYDPNQPRVPAGRSDGGQWTDRNGSQRTSLRTAYDAVESFSAARRRRRPVAFCMAQYAVDGLLCNSIESSKRRACWTQAGERLSACIGGRQIPPLNY